MSLRAIAATFLAAAAVTVTAALVQPEGVAAAPPEDIAFDYTGRGSSNTSVLTGDMEGGGGGFDADIDIGQEGNSIWVYVVIDPDGDSESWELSGRYGNGRFWCSGGVNESDFVSITGTVRGAPGKLVLKGKGTYLADDHYSDLKFSVKQLAEEPK